MSHMFSAVMGACLVLTVYSAPEWAFGFAAAAVAAGIFWTLEKS